MSPRFLRFLSWVAESKNKFVIFLDFGKTMTLGWFSLRNGTFVIPQLYELVILVKFQKNDIPKFFQHHLSWYVLLLGNNNDNDHEDDEDDKGHGHDNDCMTISRTSRVAYFVVLRKSVYFFFKVKLIFFSVNSNHMKSSQHWEKNSTKVTEYTYGGHVETPFWVGKDMSSI